QNYRDWKDSGYLRGLFYSYRYFFDITMPARANRNAIIFAGTMGLIRRSAFERVGGWDESVITEDAEASLRMLGLGSVGVYEPTVWGEGLMPLSFDGLKKQRFRWALGGIQILRRQWRELVPLAPHRLQLTWGQRLNYLFGSVHWFGDLLTVGFTFLLLLTAVASALHHRLPIRELAGGSILRHRIVAGHPGVGRGGGDADHRPGDRNRHPRRDAALRGLDLWQRALGEPRRGRRSADALPTDLRALGAKHRRSPATTEPSRHRPGGAGGGRRRGARIGPPQRTP